MISDAATRMFTDEEESRIFSIAGELAAANTKLAEHATGDIAMMQHVVSSYDLAEISAGIRRLMMVCQEALGRE